MLLPPKGNRAMAATSRFANGNHLLQALSVTDRALLEPHLEPVDLPLRHGMETPNKRIEDVFFMETGFASVVGIQGNGVAVEIGIIGCEGMTGTAVVLGTDRSPHSTYIQMKGAGPKIAASDLRTVFGASPSMQMVLMKFVQAFMIQTAHTAVANARAKLHERLARWILMAHDRVAGDTLQLTHEFLSLMLAVRRAGVTEAIHTLQKQKLIEAHRANITVLNRKGIENVAGNFYGVPEAEYRRLMSS
jgi:CRP-like cAMP-binding protein